MSCHTRESRRSAALLHAWRRILPSVAVALGFAPAQSEFRDDLRRLLESHALFVEQRQIRIVRRGEVRVDRLEPEVGAAQHLRQRAAQVVVAKPEPVHAGIDLQVIADGRPARRRGRLDRPRGGRRRDGRRQRKLEQPVEVADAQRAEHEDRHRHARAAEDDPFFDIRARQHRRARLLEREGDALRAVAVGVGFDDGDDAGRRRRVWRPGLRRPVATA